MRLMRPLPEPFGGAMFGGGGEIRTHEGLSPPLVFKTSAINHSATPPEIYHITFLGQCKWFIVHIYTN